jgi:hypothetical protein
MTNQRKHVTQMTRNEVSAILDYIQGLRLTGFDNTHVAERKDKWCVSDGEIRQAIKRGDLIECHANNLPDVRMVMRADCGIRSVCVCLSHTGEIVTVWVNTTNDHHATLRTDEYQWKANLSHVFGALKGNHGTQLQTV